MATLEIPIKNDSSAFRMQVPLEDRLYFLEFTFNTRMNRWIMDIESDTQTQLVVGVPLFTNVSLLDGFMMDGLPPGSFVCLDLADKDRNPDRENFGGDVRLYYTESTDV